MADRSGYIGRAPGDSSVIIARKAYEPTGVQTDFTFNSGYTPGYCDVYLNGVKLIDEKDYTASNGSTVGLTSAAQNGDIVELVVYKAYNLGVPLADVTGNLDVTGNISASSSITAGTLFGDGSNISNIAGVAITQYIDANSLTVIGSPGVSTITRLGATDLNVTGIITANGLSGNVTGAAITITGNATFNSNVTIGGTLTYEDVTNIDSLGIVTARTGVNVSGGQLQVGVAYSVGAAGVATAAGFVGPLTGAVTGNADTATLATSVTVTANNSTDETVYPIFVDGATGTQGAESDTGLTYNPSDGNLTSTTFTGALTGNVTGTASNASGATGDFSIADKIVHTGDTNTAIRFPAADTVTVETGGVETLRIDSSQNVGIGTDNPSQKLHIWDDSPAIRLQDTSPYVANQYGHISQSGGVLQLQARGDGATHGGIYLYSVNNSETLNVYRVTDNYHLWYTASDSNVEKMRLSDAGYLGIGTGNPGARLHITGDDAGSSRFEVDRDNGGRFFVGSTGSAGYIQTPDANPIDVYTAASKRVTIGSGGDVDICGTAAGVSSVTWDASANSLIFKDNSYANFGDGTDLKIYHQSSYPRNVIESSGADLVVLTSAPSGTNEKALAVSRNGSVQLYYDNNERFATTGAGSTSVGISTVQDFSAVGMLKERVRTMANKLSAATDINVDEGNIWYFSTNETGTATPNIRYSAGESLNNKMLIGDTITVTIIYKPNGAGYYAALNVDGSGVTEEWNGGSAPSSANAGGYDVLTHTLVKTADATFLCLSNVSNFA